MKNVFFFVLAFITIATNAQNYCANEGVITTYEWIANVQVSTFQNPSDNDGGYADFTNEEPIVLPQLATPTIKLTPGIGANNDTPYEYWRVWLDFNNDYTFSDDEMIFDSNDTYEGQVQGEFFVPLTPLDTTFLITRMRVAMKFVSPEAPELPQACGGFTYGEVEDYAVKILETNIPFPSTSNTNILIDENWKLFPNPANEVLNWKGLDNKLTNIQCFDVNGKLVLIQEDVLNNKIDVGHLASGKYIITAKSKGSVIAQQFVVVR